MALTYSSYLKLDDILNSQRLLSEGEHDEMLFIVIHQTYELWFKQLIHEGLSLKKSLLAQETYQGLATLKRMLKILKTAVGQVDILETMTPVSFSSFRNRLDNASGFQSWQFRGIEFFLGVKNQERLQIYAKDSSERRFLEFHLNEPSLYDVFLRYLSLSHYKIPVDILEREVKHMYQGDPRIQAVLLEIYKKDPQKALLCELLVDFDEGIQEWRYRHVKMVERTIGDKTGTGGSSGAHYLRNTLFKPVFVDLWRIRDQL